MMGALHRIASALVAGAVRLGRTRPRLENGSPLLTRFRWLIQLRWVAILGVSAAVATSRWGLGLLPTSSLAPMGAILGAMAAYNAVFYRMDRQAKDSQDWTFPQILLDLAALTGLLHFSGGIQNPFFLFFLFHVILAGILLTRRECFIIAALSFGLFSALILWDQTGILPCPRLAGFPEPPPVLSLGTLFAFGATVFIAAHFTTAIMGDLRGATADLSREKAVLDDIIQGIGAGLIVLDAQNRAVWANQKSLEWFPLLRTGETCHQALDGRPLPCPGCHAQAAAERGQPCAFERTQGERRFNVTQTAVHDTHGALSRRLLLIQDVTLQRRMEECLLQSGKLAAVGTLASGIAHELNNPLATISASADYLRELADERRLEGPFPRHLRRITDHVYRCKEIIDALLGLARQQEQELASTDVNGAMRELVRLAGKDLRPALDLDASRPMALANPRFLQNVVLNLLLNARDAAGPDRPVELRTSSDQGSVAIIVHDDGPGIPPEILPRIFEPFFTTKPAGRGTGLGLFLCHRMVEAMGGRIEVVSSPGHGTSVSVLLSKVASLEPQPR